MKNFLIVSILLVFIFISPKFIIAQDISGFNCGIAEDLGRNKCCKPTAMVNVDIPDLGHGLNIIRDVLVGPVTIVFQKVIDPWLKYKNVISGPCQTGVPKPDPTSPSCTCVVTITPTPGPLIALSEFCKSQSKASEQISCLNCAKNGGVWSGLGCIQTESKRFIEETIFGLGIGLAGMVSLLCIIYAAFTMQSSQGNPEKIKKAQELLTSCIMGLILIIFSVFILRLIGVSILRIPGFS